MNEFPATHYVVGFVFAVAVVATVAGALIAVLATRIIRSVCGLAICCLGLAGLYYFLHSPFLSLMEILIYVGAICVTIVFAVMLAEPDEAPSRETSRQAFFWGGAALLVSGAVFWGVSFLGVRHPWPPPLARENATFSVGDFVNLPSLARKLKQPSRAVDTWLAGQLSSATKAALASYEAQGSDSTPLQAALLQDLNRFVRGSLIHQHQRFDGVAMRSETQTLLSQNPQGGDLARLNRLLLEDACPLELSRREETVRKIGISLLTQYSLAFELISLVLLVAILGALVIARYGRTKP